MTVAADQRCCSQIWVVAGVIAEIAAEVAAEVVAEVAAEIAVEVVAEVFVELAAGGLGCRLQIWLVVLVV